MPVRHSPPPVGAAPAQETLQRPKRITAKQDKEQRLQDLAEAGPGSLTPSTARRDPTPKQAKPLPSATSVSKTSKKTTATPPPAPTQETNSSESQKENDNRADKR